MSGGIEQFSIGEEMDRLAALMTEHGLKLEIGRAPWNKGWIGIVHGQRPRAWHVVAEHAELSFMLANLRQAAEAMIAREVSPPLPKES